MKTKREDWLDAGFDLLRRGEEITVERLCAALERTKGSFYHHYADIPAFRAALLEAWNERHTQAPIDVAETVKSSDRRAALQRAVSGLDYRLETAIRHWAERDAHAAAACKTVDARRIRYLQSLWQADGKSKRVASQLAELEYAAFLGMNTIHGAQARKQRDTLALLLRALASVTK